MAARPAWPLWDLVNRFVVRLEQSFMTDKDISPALVHRIACAKILCVEFAIKYVIQDSITCTLLLHSLCRSWLV